MDRIVEPNSSRINEIRTNVPIQYIYVRTGHMALSCCNRNRHRRRRSLLLQDRSSISLCYNIIVVSVFVHV